MIRLITYSDSNMTISAEKCVQSAIKYGGVTEAVRYGPEAISNEFKEFNKDIFIEGARGAGCFWLFKPYIIYKEMLTMKDGEILCYSDAGIEFIDRLGHIIDRMKDDPFFFTNGFLHHEWCKMDAITEILPYHYMEVQERGRGELWDFTQIQASLLFFRVNDDTRDFVKEWLLMCQMPGLIDDSDSVAINSPTFAEHRHDQAILTCLAIKYKIDYNQLWCDKIWQNQRHRWPHSDYPPILIHTRKRNHEH